MMPSWRKTCSKFPRVMKMPVVRVSSGGCVPSFTHAWSISLLRKPSPGADAGMEPKNPVGFVDGDELEAVAVRLADDRGAEPHIGCRDDKTLRIERGEIVERRDDFFSVGHIEHDDFEAVVGHRFLGSFPLKMKPRFLGLFDQKPEFAFSGRGRRSRRRRGSGARSFLPQPTHKVVHTTASVSNGGMGLFMVSTLSRQARCRAQAVAERFAKNAFSRRSRRNASTPDAGSRSQGGSHFLANSARIVQRSLVTVFRDRIRA